MDFIGTPVSTVVASIPPNNNEGYKTAFEVLLASKLQPNLTQVKVEQGSVEETALVSQEGMVTELKEGMVTELKDLEATELQIEESYIRKELAFELIGYNDKGKSQYRCCLCNALVMDPTEHRVVHAEDRPYICNHEGCGKAYKSKPALKHHFISNHADVISHRCLRCAKCFKTEYLLKKHVTITCNDSRPFVCRTCGKTFKTLAKLKYHEGTHAVLKPYQCNVCLKPMATKAHLKVHMIVHSEGNFGCFCGKHFKSAKRYQEHYKLSHDANHPYRCDVCERNFKNFDTLEHHKLSHDRPFSCRVCKKGFRQILSCRMHERVKHQIDAPTSSSDADKDTVCPICNKLFKNNHSMEVHLTVHMLEDIFPCPQCGKKFKLQKHLVSHMTVHSERKLPCDVCGKKFKHEKNLKIHMNSHSKPFCCNKCGARFANERYLKTHEKKHTKGAAPKIYRCPYCETVCPSLSNVKLHMEEEHADKPKVHVSSETPLSLLSVPKSRSVSLASVKSVHRGIYNCEVCDDVFDREDTLTKHELYRHSDIERIPCSECGVKFITARTIKIHLFLQHNIGDASSCEDCYREFYSKEDLKRHILIVHDTHDTSFQDQSPSRLDQSYHLVDPAQVVAVKNKPLSHLDPSKVVAVENKPLSYLCIVCVKRFPNKSSLSKHESEHTDEIYCCRICNESHETLEELKIHCSSCSETKCVYCCQEFISREKLKKHIAFHQMGNIVYKCSVCSKDFSNVVELKKHKETHDYIKFSPNKNVIILKASTTPTRKDSVKSSFKSLLSGFAK